MVISKINLKHNEFKSYIKLKRRKILNVVIIMSVEKPVYKKSIEKIIRNNSELSIESVYDGVISKNGLDKQCLTIREKNKILEEITTYKSRNKKIDLLKYIKNINLDLLNSIQLRDNSMNCAKLFKLDFNNTNYLINKNKKIIGTLDQWIDEENTIPREFKTSDNTVLNPMTNLPINEVTLNHASEIYSGILPGVYREYTYNEELEAFMASNNILI